MPPPAKILSLGKGSRQLTTLTCQWFLRGGPGERRRDLWTLSPAREECKILWSSRRIQSFLLPGSNLYCKHGYNCGAHPFEKDRVPAVMPKQLRALDKSYFEFVAELVGLLEEARRNSARSVNSIMTATYWEIGRRIVEQEQRWTKAGAVREGVAAPLGRGPLFPVWQRLFRTELARHARILSGLVNSADSVCGIG